MLKLAVLLAVLCLGTAGDAHAQQKALLLFGGKDHKVLLGCLNCANTSPLSICNKFGDYGSKFNSKSIWDQFGDYGSKFNSYSPWNAYSTDAPIIVDNDGGSYGYFSINQFHHDRTRISWALEVLAYEEKHDDLDETRDFFCAA